MFRKIIIIMLLFIEPGFGLPIRACYCAPPAKPPTAEELMNTYDLVFMGNVLEVTLDNWGMMVRFAVEQSWKSDNETEVSISTSGTGSACGYLFKKDQRYLVFAKGNKCIFFTSLCDPNVPYEEAKVIIHKLDAYAAHMKKTN